MFTEKTNEKVNKNSTEYVLTRELLIQGRVWIGHTHIQLANFFGIIKIEFNE